MVAVPTARKPSAKSAAGARSTEKSSPRSHHATHPSWIDMITECITTTPDGTRQGVSRPTIKKFVDSKYHLAMNASAASQLNRAITHGADKGNFVLPKGPSGKVKLAPKRHGDSAKENTKPASKRTSAKEEPAPKPKTAKKPPSAAPKPKATPAAEGAVATKGAPSTKKYASTAKKARTATVTGRKAPARKAATKRGGAKKAITGDTAATRTKRAAKGKTKKASVTSASKRKTKTTAT